jgi:hypothetical protein
MFSTFSTFSSTNKQNRLASILSSYVFTPATSQFTSQSLTLSNQSYSKQKSTYNVLFSSAYDGTWNGYKAFNGSTSSGNNWFSARTYNTSGPYVGSQSTVAGNVTYSGEWLQIQLPSAITLTSYGILGASFTAVETFPATWYIMGSNDGSTWNLLDSKSVTSSYWTSTTTPVSFPLNLIATYSYYRIAINSICGGQFAYAGLCQFNLTGF